MSFVDLLRDSVAALPTGLHLSVPLTGAARVEDGRVLVRLAIDGRMLPGGLFELRADGSLHEITPPAGCGDGD